MKKIGFTCGVFDMFHIGHLNLLERCKEHCDYLIVAVCNDQYVKEHKKKEPVIGEEERARIVGALKCVDEVHIIDSLPILDKTVARERFYFDVIFTGSDWVGSERFEKAAEGFKSRGMDVEIVFLPYTQGVSSSQLRERLKKEK